MPTYPQASGGTIGTLLRQIQEERSANPAVNPPSNEPGSPIRELVQGPLTQVEAPESTRTIAIRPETAPIAPGSTAPDVVAPASPVLPGEAAPSVVAPAAPAPAPTPSNGPSAPAPSQVAASQPSAPRTTSPSLATSIQPTSVAAAKASAPVNKAPIPTPTPAPQKPPTPAPVPAPQQSRVGPLIVQGPQFQGANPGQNAFDRFINGVLKRTNTSAIASKIFPNLFG